LLKPLKVKLGFIWEILKFSLRFWFATVSQNQINSEKIPKKQPFLICILISFVVFKKNYYNFAEKNTTFLHLWTLKTSFCNSGQTDLMPIPVWPVHKGRGDKRGISRMMF
jgi:hypothetical protein